MAGPSSRIDRPVVLYDADCGFCRWSLGLILAWDGRRRLRPLAIDSPEGAGLLSDLDPERRQGSWHFIDRAGKRSSGGMAAEPLLQELPGGGPLASLVEHFPRLTEGVYAWVVRNRGSLGKAIPAGAKRRAARRIELRS
jgi:predicted DCC family thiol-disulfide oxidoreductase YuxK